jgi:hypothetical protein
MLIVKGELCTEPPFWKPIDGFFGSESRKLKKP